MESQTSAATATPAELKLYTHAHIHPDDPAFNLSLALRITGDVDLPRLRRVLGRLGAGIRALNTSFERHDGQVLAVHRPYPGSPEDLVPVTDLTGDGRRTVTDLLTREVDTPLAPDAPRQFTFRLYRDDDAVYLTMFFSHLVADGYSHFNLVSEIARLYADPDAELADSVLDAPSLLVQPRRPTEQAVAFFRDQLSGLTTLSDDRLLGRRGPDGALHGEERHLLLDPATSARVRRRAEELSCTPFTFFLAAYLVTYARCTGGRTPVVGIPVSNRRGPRQRASFGYFVNTLPLVTDLTAHETFADLCRSLESTKTMLLRHQDFDLAAVAREVMPGAVDGPMSCDQTFTYYKQPLKIRLGDCTVEQLPLRRKVVKYPMSMNVEDHGEDFEIHAECSHEQWATDPLAVMHHIVRLVAETPERRITELPALDGPARRRLEALVNPAAADLPDPALPASLADWFESVALAHPERTAVVHNGATLTYGELNDRADRVAGHLAAHVPGQYVGIAMRRSPDLVAAVLGVLKAGRAYVPLDPNSPAARIHQILDSFPGGLPVIEDEHRWPGAELLSPVAAADLAGAEPSAAAAVRHADDCAYVIFTSGSTGRPKGVRVTHRNVMRLMDAAQKDFGFGAKDTWSLFHSYAFDFSVWEIFGALLYGGRLAVVPEDTAKSPEEFRELLIRDQVTVLNQTPSAFNQLLKVLRPGDAQDLAVRHVVFGGEALRYAALCPWYDLMGERARLVNMYGITETTVHVTYHEVTPDQAQTETASVIGRPLSHLTVTVVDRDGHVCPPGVPGEIQVGGAGVTLGYLGRPELNAERFPVVDGHRVYRSGDLGLVRPDGTLVHLGRMDKQVQLRGFRIELGEVESAFLAVTGVQECAVRLDERDPGHPGLVAFVAGPELPPDAKIRQEVRNRLPGYMVPSRVVRSAALPLTVNGKVDDAALPWPQSADQPATAAPAEAADTTAAAVHAVWSRVLHTTDFGADDNFFDVGGSSMHIVEVHRRLQQELSVPDLEMIQLFTHTTVRRLAAHIESIRGTAGV
ncbi:amino acid adenylation domain-containing protein [Streptomyces sp. NPDC007971]|uniref:non-ribosomal peptide synthetase n=1 Tax=Streptomyces sp. NPDC007971 TaxID=3364799 RepID=UPI0036ED51C6